MSKVTKRPFYQRFPEENWYILAFEQNIDAVIGPFSNRIEAEYFRQWPRGKQSDVSLSHIGGTVFRFDGKVPSHTVAPENAVSHIWGNGI